MSVEERYPAGGVTRTTYCPGARVGNRYSPLAVVVWLATARPFASTAGVVPSAANSATVAPESGLSVAASYTPLLATSSNTRLPSRSGWKNPKSRVRLPLVSSVSTATSGSPFEVSVTGLLATTPPVTTPLSSLSVSLSGLAVVGMSVEERYPAGGVTRTTYCPGARLVNRYSPVAVVVWLATARPLASTAGVVPSLWHSATVAPESGLSVPASKTPLLATSSNTRLPSRSGWKKPKSRVRLPLVSSVSSATSGSPFEVSVTGLLATTPPVTTPLSSLSVSLSGLAVVGISVEERYPAGGVTRTTYCPGARLVNRYSPVAVVVWLATARPLASTAGVVPSLWNSATVAPESGLSVPASKTPLFATSSNTRLPSRSGWKKPKSRVRLPLVSSVSSATSGSPFDVSVTELLATIPPVTLHVALPFLSLSGLAVVGISVEERYP